jgi:hypothetical protein
LKVVAGTFVGRSFDRRPFLGAERRALVGIEFERALLQLDQLDPVRVGVEIVVQVVAPSLRRP